MIYRKATFNDVEEIYNLVNLYAQEGVCLLYTSDAADE